MNSTSLVWILLLSLIASYVAQSSDSESSDSMDSPQSNSDSDSHDGAGPAMEKNNESGLSAIDNSNQSDIIKHDQIIIASLSIVIAILLIIIGTVLGIWYLRYKNQKIGKGEIVPCVDEEDEDQGKESDGPSNAKETDGLFV
mmetsp:Transcript_73875/g.66495  ORF Transcript_73875/g.66495 Transcript_73875/m.66495 type:complete len:142 (+) Transcript_73875:77-502(+)|eukprot:CAMPEP_0201588922 /NCGR_PEP_ID=MMETSP0190_2-20130828/160559_1 /ASSEMBLY_ACC=CAM_ASM_000263 /TAXON_ID=37353 /ORGANISM="Rosalina sp." /LENGTH=141 /DNA_ID=CAMNT_0048042007 /DNA_START=74 /DNA_END=499 /DNA_ORIENTATION=+